MTLNGWAVILIEHNVYRTGLFNWFNKQAQCTTVLCIRQVEGAVCADSTLFVQLCIYSEQCVRMVY